MSIKQKFMICSIVILVVPVIMIILLSLLMLGIFIFLHPAVELSLTEGLEISNPLVLKFIFAETVMALSVIIMTVIGVSTYLSRSVIKPVTELTTAMEHLKNGDLSYEFSGSGDREIRELCRSYDELRLHLQKTSAETLEYENEQRMMLANISHDIKTPITSIRGYVEGIQDGIADTPEKMDKYLNTIRSKTYTIEHMADNLSLYAKLEMRRMNYHMEITDIITFLKTSAEGFELDLNHNDMELSCDIPDISIPVKFDKEKLHRVFANIIGNSIKYKKDGAGSLKISASLSDRRVLISFRDTGKGISEEDLEKVFERFYRTDTSRNSKIGGNGLGLSICRRIVEDHGGKIWIRSELGEGTEVSVLLPCKSNEKGAVNI